MLLKKETVSVTVVAATGAANTNNLKGVVEQLIITPLDSNGAEVTTSEWSLSIIDRDNDVLRKYASETGRVEDVRRFPVGSDRLEKLTFQFTGITGTVATMKSLLRMTE